MPKFALALCAISLLAQSPDNRPAFEAATVKLNTSNSGSSTSNGNRSQVLMENLTLHRLIERAYAVKPFQVSGPAWTENIRFDVAAKYPPDTKDADRPAMLRTLLEDRFHLQVHRETRQISGYALVVAKGGFKLQPAEDASRQSDGTNSHNHLVTMNVKHTSMAQLADLIARNQSVPVVDQTGIAGVYDFELHWTDDVQTSDPTPSLFDAIQESLGLRLQATRVPVEIVVVDHVERNPVEN